MTITSGAKQFSSGDALFLYLERECSPLNVASVFDFEGIIPLEECSRFIESKLPLIPRYRQHVVMPTLHSGLPVWDRDPDFDIRNHVRQIMLKHGTEDELKSVASDILSTTLDRSHPLWDLTLLRGLKGNRTGVLARVHHCLADGIAGVGLMNVLMDTEKTPPPPSRKPQERRPSTPRRDVGIAFLEGVLDTYSSAVQRIFKLQSNVLTGIEMLANAGRSAVEELLHVAPELAMPAERLPFNKICRGPQKFAWTEVSMREMQGIRDASGGTLNDVVLAAFTSAIRRYAETHGVRIKGRQLRVVIPVNVRGGGSAKELGNRISFVPANIPLDLEDPRELIVAVRERMEYLKSMHAAEFVGLFGMLIGSLPTPIQALALPYAGQLPISLCNTICTNVPGPQVPLYLLGHKMLRWYPYVPIGGEMGMNCAVITYHGTAYFGFTADSYAMPDVAKLEEFLPASFDEMRKAFGLKAQKPRPRKSKVSPSKENMAAAPIPVKSVRTVESKKKDKLSMSIGATA